MDLGTLIGLVVSVGAIMLSAVIEGGDAGPAALLRLLNVPGALIVFGGTIGTLLVCFRLENTMKIGQLIGLAFKGNTTNIHELINTLTGFCDVARKEGILALESKVGSIKDKFMQKGFQFLVDGTDPTLLREMLETEIYCMEERHKVGISIFQQAGGLAPTMGMIGTVMGLVNVLANMSDTSTLGPAISTAFIATFYGVFSANVFWLPIGNKLKVASKEEVAQKQIILEGILSIQAGEHPRVVLEKLLSFVAPDKRANFNKKQGSG
jgi:chemotaxis protein MotA